MPTTPTKCITDDRIVSYLYNEIADDDRVEFETHLADCMACTDEFAEMAHSRFSVFEWQKEFALIPTPAIEIPGMVGATQIPSRKWFEMWGVQIRWAVRAAIPVFPLIAIVLGVWFAAATRSHDQTETLQPVSSPESVGPLRADSVIPPAGSQSVPVLASKRKAVIASPTRITMRTLARAKERPARQLEADDTVPAPIPAKTDRDRKNTRRPTLSGDEDDADTSLRLADLFADADTVK